MAIANPLWRDSENYGALMMGITISERTVSCFLRTVPRLLFSDMKDLSRESLGSNRIS